MIQFLSDMFTLTVLTFTLFFMFSLSGIINVKFKSPGKDDLNRLTKAQQKSKEFIRILYNAVHVIDKSKRFYSDKPYQRKDYEFLLSEAEDAENLKSAVSMILKIKYKDFHTEETGFKEFFRRNLVLFKIKHESKITMKKLLKAEAVCAKLIEEFKLKNSSFSSANKFGL